MSSNPIITSFELAAERCDDLAPLVYQRLFGQYPELELFFVMDTTGAARGSMLAWVINALVDGAGEGSYGHNLIKAEVVNHSGMGVAPEQFGLFFVAIAATLKDLLGPDWTPAMAHAWKTLLAELDGFVRHPA